MQIGLLGLGKMGRNIAEKLMADQHEVVVWNRSHEVLDKLRVEKSAFILKGHLVITRTFDELKTTLRKPRILWVMLPAGDPTETVLKEMTNEVVEEGDIIIDGGNANYQDTERRAEEFKQKGIRYLGIGVSGGLHGFENGYPLMVGGDKDAYEYVKPILDSLAKPYGIHTYFGTGGAGHYVKMVHNGIEYGMMQSLAEGLGVLARSDYKLNLLEVTRNWQGGSIVASFLLDMAHNALAKDPTLSQTDGYIAATGEAEWTVQKAKEEKIPIEVIEQSLEFRKKSQYDKATQETFAAKMVSALRHEFGGHAQKMPEGTLEEPTTK
jgi:6-phosphogluconate dehydrogenase